MKCFLGEKNDSAVNCEVDCLKSVVIFEDIHIFPVYDAIDEALEEIDLYLGKYDVQEYEITNKLFCSLKNMDRKGLFEKMYNMIVFCDMYKHIAVGECSSRMLVI